RGRDQYGSLCEEWSGQFPEHPSCCGQRGDRAGSGSRALGVTEATSGQGTGWFIHSHSTNPLGLVVDYTVDSPDDTVHYFFRGVDATATRVQLRSDGDVWTLDSGILTSDRTMKENIVDATPKLDDVMRLRIVNSNWTTEFHPVGENQRRKRIGYIAQEVEDVFPGLVGENAIVEEVRNAKGRITRRAVFKKDLRSSAIGAPILVKAFQEAVTEYRTEIANLKDQLTTLEGEHETRLTALEADMEALKPPELRLAA
ncbi:hypothetical protein LCGC14_1090900, partial [marine sediment metagenome]